MRVCIVLCLIVTLTVTSCGKPDVPPSTPQAQPQPNPPAQVLNQNEWKEFTSEEHGFVVAFPTAPETQNNENEYKFGKVTIRDYTSRPTRNVIWRVAVHNYPEPFASWIKPGTLVESMRDGAAENFNGKPENVKAISLDGFPGEEFVVHSSDPFTNKPLTLTCRLFAVKGRVYQLAVVAAPDDDARGKGGSKFFESFRLLNKGEKEHIKDLTDISSNSIYHKMLSGRRFTLWMKPGTCERHPTLERL